MNQVAKSRSTPYYLIASTLYFVVTGMYFLIQDGIAISQYWHIVCDVCVVTLHRPCWSNKKANSKFQFFFDRSSRCASVVNVFLPKIATREKIYLPRDPARNYPLCDRCYNTPLCP